MNYKIRINNEFIKINDEDNKILFDNNTFSDTILNIFNDIYLKLTKDNDLLYHVYPIDTKISADKILKYINEYFNTSIKNIIYFDNDIRLDKEILIKFINNINKTSTIDIISNLSIIYKDVILFNLYYDNPADNIFYVICKNKICNDNCININKYNSMNINKNKSYIYDFLFSYYIGLTDIINTYDHLDDKQNINTYTIYVQNFKDMSKC